MNETTTKTRKLSEAEATEAWENDPQTWIEEGWTTAITLYDSPEGPKVAWYPVQNFNCPDTFYLLFGEDSRKRVARMLQDPSYVTKRFTRNQRVLHSANGHRWYGLFLDYVVGTDRQKCFILTDCGSRAEFAVRIVVSVSDLVPG